MKAELFKEMVAGFDEAVKHRRGQKARVRVSRFSSSGSLLQGLKKQHGCIKLGVKIRVVLIASLSPALLYGQCGANKPVKILVQKSYHKDNVAVPNPNSSKGGMWLLGFAPAMQEGSEA